MGGIAKTAVWLIILGLILLILNWMQDILINGSRKLIGR